MKSRKSSEPIHLIKKVLSNRVNSVPSLKPKNHYLLTNKQIRPQSKKTILIQKYVLNSNKKGMYIKNVNRSAGNIFKNKPLKEITEKNPKNIIKKIKKNKTINNH